MKTSPHLKAILSLVAIFVLGATMGILAELRWKDASQYAFAFILGTTLAFLLLAYRFNVRAGLLVPAYAMGIMLMFCLLLAVKMLYHSWGKKAKLLTIYAYIFWLALYVAK